MIENPLIVIAAAFFAFAATASADNTGGNGAAPVRGGDVLHYMPVLGGYETRNGEAEFNRPLYGWHGDDRELNPCKSLPWTGDRPKVALKVFKGYRLDKRVRGVLQFGGGGEDITYRYVWGRAEYDLKDKGTVKMVRSASSDGLLVETTGDLPPKFDGEWTLAANGERNGRAYYDFERKGMVREGVGDVAAMFDAATNHFECIARTIEIKTPDPLLDSLLPCQLLVADAMFEGRHITHGATNWKQAFAGWRVGYICYATGWVERFKENAREHFRSQKADGRIPNEPKRDSQYNMCEEFTVSVMRYWKWTGDDDFMREIAYDGVKRHLAWMDRNMKVPDTELYENWLNTWNTDNKWCNGGAGTIASSYYAYDCRVMAEVAQRLGKADDAAYFAGRAKTVEEAVAKSLWHEGDGVWGEYRERFGLKRLMRAPDLSTVYIAIDNLPFDLARNRRAVAWVEDNVPTFFAKDGATLLYSSNRLPLFWSSCGRYPNETTFWSLACYQTGEPELGWRHLHDVAAISARGTGGGPGVVTCDLNFDFACYSNIDFADSTAGFIRTVAEGVFGIVAGKEIRPSFPASWDEAEIKSPYISYRWTRKGGVKMTGGSRAATVKVVPAPAPQFAGDAIPGRHARWGHPKGEGTDLSVPQGGREEYVELSGVFNQNLRLLHAGKYSPRIGNVPWSKSIPRSVMANGRSWWERHEVVGNRHGRKDWCVPEKLDWPSDGILATQYGPSFRLGAADGSNAVFTAFYDQFPDEVSIPLSGTAEKVAFMTAISTNPNQGWMEAATIAVEYADGSSETLSLVPPDNCDDWLSYSHGHHSYLDMKRDCRPYAIKGCPVMFGETAHGNVHALDLDPSKQLKRVRFACRGTETFAGLLAVTLYHKAQDRGAGRAQAEASDVAQECPVSANVCGHENTEWSRSYAYHLTDARKSLPRVLLVGDSICRAYEGEVRRLLDGKMNVSYWASSYCVTSPNYRTFLGIFLDEAKYDVIHFSNGLHSLGTPTPQWENAFESTLRFIREKQPSAKIVWCTITPMQDEERTAKVKELNAAGAKVVGRVGGILTNDLFALLDPLDRRTNWRDAYHHTSKVYKMEAKKVADAVLAANRQR